MNALWTVAFYSFGMWSKAFVWTGRQSHLVVNEDLKMVCLTITKIKQHKLNQWQLKRQNVLRAISKIFLKQSKLSDFFLIHKKNVRIWYKERHKMQILHQRTIHRNHCQEKLSTMIAPSFSLIIIDISFENNIIIIHFITSKFQSSNFLI